MKESFISVTGLGVCRSVSAFALVALVSGFGLEAAGQDGPRLRPQNLSSHAPEFFRELLSGRVWVFERDGRAAATYFGKDGSVKGCAWPRQMKGYVPYRSDTRWRIGTPSGRSNLELNWPGSEGLAWSRRVIVYDRETGRFHSEKFNTRIRAWYVDRDGWIQDGWPGAFRNACNTLTLPWDLATVSEQDSLDLASLEKNAPKVTHLPGSEFSYPGATGVGDSRGKPTMTIEEVVEERRRTHGMIRLRNIGGRSVGVDRPGGIRELWLLDDNDDVVDVATIRPIEDGSYMRIRWEKTGQTATPRVGYPVPAMSTGKLHPAFAMMRDLAEAGRSVAVEGAEYVFSPDRKVVRAGEAGEWWLSRGEVHVKFGSEVRKWPWRVFAERTGWQATER